MIICVPPAYRRHFYLYMGVGGSPINVRERQSSLRRRWERDMDVFLPSPHDSNLPLTKYQARAGDNNAAMPWVCGQVNRTLVLRCIRVEKPNDNSPVMIISFPRRLEHAELWPHTWPASHQHLREMREKIWENTGQWNDSASFKNNDFKDLYLLKFWKGFYLFFIF